MRKRFKLSRSKSRRLFRKGAKRVHSRNSRAMVMRGGYRI